MTRNVRYNCYPHIRFLPTHPHLAPQILFAFYLLPHLQIRLLPIADPLFAIFRLKEDGPDEWL